MKTLRAEEFYKLAVMLGRITEYLSSGISAAEKVKNKEKLGEQDKKGLVKAMSSVIEQAGEINANITEMAARDLLKGLEGDATWADLREGVRDIEVTLRRETSKLAFYTVNPSMSGLVDNSDDVFGSEFQVKFPSAMYDLQEACKCLGLGRNTAAAFHLMRIVEVLLRAIGASLSIPAPSGADKNWGNMLSAIKTNMTARNQKSNAGWKANDRNFFEDVYASIDAVRVAWRNTTMHVERRYDEDEAEHLLHVVKALAKKLSGRCDEAGSPAA